MDTVTVPNSVYVDGQWATAHWMAEVADEATGELVITATVAGEGAPHVAALRMDATLVRDLRALAGFGEPSTNAAHTNARMGEIEAAVDRVDLWRAITELTSGLHGAYERIGVYDASLRRELRRVELRLDALELSKDPRLVEDEQTDIPSELSTAEFIAIDADARRWRK